MRYPFVKLITGAGGKQACWLAMILLWSCVYLLASWYSSYSSTLFMQRVFGFAALRTCSFSHVWFKLSFITKRCLSKPCHSRSVWVKRNPVVRQHLCPLLAITFLKTRIETQCRTTAGACGTRWLQQVTLWFCFAGCKMEKLFTQLSLNSFFLKLSWNSSSVKQRVGTPNG